LRLDYPSSSRRRYILEEKGHEGWELVRIETLSSLSSYRDKDTVEAYGEYLQKFPDDPPEDVEFARTRLQLLKRPQEEEKQRIPTDKLRGPEVVSITSPTDARVVSEYDRFKGETTITLRDSTGEGIRIGGGLMFKLIGTKGEPDSSFLLFSVLGSEWHYLHYHELVILIDGQTRITPTVSHTGRVLGTEVFGVLTVEQMFAPLPDRTLRKFTTATRVEGRLGLTEFDLTPLLPAVREYLTVIAAAPPKKSRTHAPK
jgi:hypothetical protein